MIEASLDFTLIKLFSFKKKLTWFLKNVVKRNLKVKLYYVHYKMAQRSFQNKY